MRIPAPVRGLRAAFVFLTRIPVGGFPYSKDDWRWSSAYFTLVGACVGAVMVGVMLATAPLGPWPSALLAVCASLLITGGFHEDGLADTADALGGGYDRERVLEILKDSRIGTFGAAALVVSIGLRVALMAQLGDHLWVLVFVQSASRLPPIWIMVFLPYATPRNARSRDVARADGYQGVMAAVWPSLVASYVIADPFVAGVCAVLSGVLGVYLGWRFYARVGGVTGDFLGATQQIVECALLAALVWLL